MSRFSYYDTDEERLPEGMTRVGYDADTQVYTYEDTDGSLWEGAPGSRYGRMTCVSGPTRSTTTNASSDPDTDPLIAATGGLQYEQEHEKTSWRQEHMPLLNFFLLIGLFLLGVFWLMGLSLGGGGDAEVEVDCSAVGAQRYVVQNGDTCWAIADGKGASVEDLRRLNEGLDCDRLAVGGVLCVPSS